MKNGASLRSVRVPALGVLAATIAVTTSAPRPVRADANVVSARPAHGHAPHRSGPHAGPITVALGATAGESRARALFASAFADAIVQYPALRLYTEGVARPALVLTANVRAMTVERGPAGTLARCDVGIVIADGGGAVRAMLDVRRTIRADDRATDESLERTAMHSAADGAMRNLVTQFVR